MAIYYPPTKDFTQGTLGAELLEGVTASATLNTTASTLGLQNKLGTMIIDRVDANGVETSTKCEVVSFAGTSGSTVTTVVRGLAGTTDQDHAVGAIIEFGPDIIWAQGLIDFFLTEHTTAGVHTSALVTTLKASGANVTTGTSDVTIVTPKALADAGIVAPAVTLSNTATLTNKRIEPRIVTAASYTTDTGTSLSVATADQFQVTAQAGALKLNNPGGTPVAGQKLIVRIKDNGTAQALTYDTQFRASTDLALPTTTVLGKTIYMGFIFNATDTKWDLLAVLNNI